MRIGSQPLPIRAIPEAVTRRHADQRLGLGMTTMGLGIATMGLGMATMWEWLQWVWEWLQWVWCGNGYNEGMATVGLMREWLQ